MFKGGYFTLSDDLPPYSEVKPGVSVWTFGLCTEAGFEVWSWSALRASLVVW